MPQRQRRMLAPLPELSRGMGWDPNCIWFGTNSQITAALGNGVTPPVAEWLTYRCLEVLGYEGVAA